ncbi:hypothetical protein SUGI_0719410 [Cryptomeria japonica]|nr:hypothetical protein SUGI_0719410 [Cryptomeria japonica]
MFSILSRSIEISAKVKLLCSLELRLKLQIRPSTDLFPRLELSITYFSSPVRPLFLRSLIYFPLGIMELVNADEVKFDQDLWLIQIHGKQEEEKEIFASLFGVPKELLAMTPEAFIPQCVSFARDHHWRSQLYEMERYKVATARRFQKSINSDCKLETVVEVMKNLVAFEASAAPGDFTLTRYTDFMNAIVDKEEDVRLLRKSGIIYNHLVDDGKVASLWNCLRRCVKLTKVKYLDQVITDVNKHYNKRWSIAVKEKISRYIFGSWKLLTVVAKPKPKEDIEWQTRK